MNQALMAIVSIDDLFASTAGWPSKTGGKSGPGRDNAPPRK